MSDKLKVAETWFKRVWSDEDERAIHEIFVPGGDTHGVVSKSVIGPDEFAVFHRQFLKQFSNVDIQILQHIEDKDWIATRVKLSAIVKASGKNIETSGQMMTKIADGKILEAHNSLDFVTFFEQAGLLPAGAMEQCLLGESLV